MVARAVVVWLVLGSLLAAAGPAQEALQDAEAEILAGVELFDRDPKRPIAVIVEEGWVAPAQVLWRLARPAEIVAEITDGPAEFLYRPDKRGGTQNLKSVSWRSREVRLPALKVERAGYDSHISIRIDGRPAGDPIRVGVVSEGGIAKLASLPQARPAILRLDLQRRYAVVDQARVLYDADSSGPSPEGEATQDWSLVDPGSSPQLTEGGFEWCPPDVWRAPELTDSFPTGSCSTPQTTGKVIWDGMSDPKGAGFSVKPENANYLVWAAPPSQTGIDGVYRAQWGCGIALKVPNGCLLKSRVNMGGCCCTWLSLTLGYSCVWVNTTLLQQQGAGWPKCPLKVI